MISPSSATNTDLKLLRLAIDIAASARVHGNHPFGALIADNYGNVIAKAENTVITESDVTGHAETNLIRIASRDRNTNSTVSCGPRLAVVLTSA